jgi:hypothetical protein
MSNVIHAAATIFKLNICAVEQDRVERSFDMIEQSISENMKILV